MPLEEEMALTLNVESVEHRLERVADDVREEARRDRREHVRQDGVEASPRGGRFSALKMRIHAVLRGTGQMTDMDKFFEGLVDLDK